MPTIERGARPAQRAPYRRFLHFDTLIRKFTFVAIVRSAGLTPPSNRRAFENAYRLEEGVSPANISLLQLPD